MQVIHILNEIIQIHNDFIKKFYKIFTKNTDILILRWPINIFIATNIILTIEIFILDVILYFEGLNWTQIFQLFLYNVPSIFISFTNLQFAVYCIIILKLFRCINNVLYCFERFSQNYYLLLWKENNENDK